MRPPPPPPPPRARYSCGGCGLAVLVLEGAAVTVIRGCACAAPIIANAEGKAVGRGGIKHS